MTDEWWMVNDESLMMNTDADADADADVDTDADADAEQMSRSADE